MCPLKADRQLSSSSMSYQTEIAALLTLVIPPAALTVFNEIGFNIVPILISILFLYD